MKTKLKIITGILITVSLAFVMFSQYSCKKIDPSTAQNDEEGIQSLIISENFNWSTSIDATWKVTTYDNQGKPIEGLSIEIFTDDPYFDKGNLIVSGVTNSEGKYSVEYKVPAYYDSVYVMTNYIGIPSPGMTALNNGSFDIKVGGVIENNGFKDSDSNKNVEWEFELMGDYNSSGVPNYLEPENENISQDLLDDINNTLPEREPLMESHPEYLSDQYDHNINIIEDCDVWVSFVHEGAGYYNVLTYYAYDTDNAPQNPTEIEYLNVIFPNVSYAGSGGGLVSGNKVYLGQFSANTTISFALASNGYKNGNITSGNGVYYSQKNLNPENDPDFKQHSVLLNDNARDLLLLGFEDLNRQAWCDHDFNDAIFLVQANPPEGIDQSNLPLMDYEGIDTDQDGIADDADNYPDDPLRAFDNYFFNNGSFGTLAFEDMWPEVGDYDFNDAVIDYNFNQITNADNELIEIVGIFKLMAHGAYFHNGFGIQLPFDKSYIASVTGDISTGNGIVTLDSKNLEAEQELPVIIVWDDAYDILPQAGPGVGVNTTPGTEYVTPDTLTVIITLNEPIALSSSGIPPYNPFIFVDGNREIEVHLIDNVPTDLANASLLGTGADNSDPASGSYYKTANYLPWAINIIEHFDYPVEKAEITSAYLYFGEWAESEGSSYKDWWHDEAGYRNDGNIYDIPE